MRNKHYDLIVAWADGEKIEVHHSNGVWATVLFPQWDWDTQYRVKPDLVKAALTQALIDRDRYYNWADALAAHVSTLTGVDIGESTSENKSWLCAAMAADAHQPKKWKGLIDTEIDSEVRKSIEPWGFSRGVKWAEKELKARNT